MSDFPNYIAPFLPKALAKLVAKGVLTVEDLSGIIVELEREDAVAEAPLLAMPPALAEEDGPDESGIACEEEPCTTKELETQLDVLRSTFLPALEEAKLALTQEKVRIAALSTGSIVKSKEADIQKNVLEKEEDCLKQENFIASIIRGLLFKLGAEYYGSVPVIGVLDLEPLSHDEGISAQEKLEIHRRHQRIFKKLVDRNLLDKLSPEERDLFENCFYLERMLAIRKQQEENIAKGLTFAADGSRHAARFLHVFLLQHTGIGSDIEPQIAQRLFLEMHKLNHALLEQNILVCEEKIFKLKGIKPSAFHGLEADIQLKTALYAKQIEQSQEEIMRIILAEVDKNEQSGMLAAFKKGFGLSDDGGQAEFVCRESILRQLQGALHKLFNLPRKIKLPQGSVAGATVAGVATIVVSPASAMALGLTAAAAKKGLGDLQDALTTANVGELSEKYSTESGKAFDCLSLYDTFGEIGAGLVRDFYITELVVLEEFLALGGVESKDRQKAQAIYKDLYDSWETLKKSPAPEVFVASLRMVAEIKFVAYRELQKHELFAKTPIFSRADADDVLATDTIMEKKTALWRRMQQLQYLQGLKLPHNECETYYADMEVQLSKTGLLLGKGSSNSRLTIHANLEVASNPTHILERWLLNEVLFSDKAKCQEEFSLFDLQGNTVFHKICRDNNMAFLRILEGSFSSVRHGQKPSNGVASFAGKGTARNHTLAFICDLAQPNLDGYTAIQLALKHNPLQRGFITRLKGLILASVNAGDLTLDEVEKLFAFDTAKQKAVVEGKHSLKKEAAKYIEAFFAEFTPTATVDAKRSIRPPLAALHMPLLAAGPFDPREECLLLADRARQEPLALLDCPSDGPKVEEVDVDDADEAAGALILRDAHHNAEARSEILHLQRRLAAIDGGAAAGLDEDVAIRHRLSQLQRSALVPLGLLPVADSPQLSPADPKSAIVAEVVAALKASSTMTGNETSLVQAVLEGRDDFIASFLEIPCVELVTYITLKKHGGFNLIELAAILGHTETLKLLFTKLNGESVICARGALFQAAKYRTLESVKFICEGNIPNIGGLLSSKTPEDLIVGGCLTESVRCVVDSKKRAVYASATPLHALFTDSRPDVATTTALLKAFCDRGKVVASAIAATTSLGWGGESCTGYSYFSAAVDVDGNNALHILAQHCNSPEFFVALIDSAELTFAPLCDIGSTWYNKFGRLNRLFPYYLLGVANKAGQTPADIACDNGNFRMAAFLVEFLEYSSPDYQAKKAEIEAKLEAAEVAQEGVFVVLSDALDIKEQHFAPVPPPAGVSGDHDDAPPLLAATCDSPETAPVAPGSVLFRSFNSIPDLSEVEEDAPEEDLVATGGSSSPSLPL